MNTTKLLLLAVSLWGGHAAAQSRLYDRVAVDFSNDVNVAGKVLHPGSYEIRQLRNAASGARVLFITQKGGTGFEVEAATIPVLDNLTPARTRVVLRRSGGVDYLRRVWIAGKDYGYEFTISDEARAATNTNEVTLTATYTPEAPAVVAQNQPEPARQAVAAPLPTQQDNAQTPPPVAVSQQAQATPDVAQTTVPAPTLPATATNWMAYWIAGILSLVAAAVLSLFRVRSQS